MNKHILSKVVGETKLILQFRLKRVCKLVFIAVFQSKDEYLWMQDTTEAHSFSGRLELPLRHGVVPFGASLVRAVPTAWSWVRAAGARVSAVCQRSAEVLNAAGAPLQFLSQTL